ncbi:MAG: exodeoxyribonuclease V alpha subunit [Saprospiraceae bacterium]|jgi:exodeoxyribonuclease V alpha subunit
MDEIHGHIERITFQNAENGWTIARLQEPKKKDVTTIVGTMTSVQIGETLRCWGIWKNDTNFGFQFQVKDYKVEQPSTVYGIQKYLASGMIKGVGKEFAKRIVKQYGVETLNVINDTPDVLMDIDGIGAKRLERIKTCWQEQKSIREVMVFMQSHDISPTYAQKVFKQYGDASIEVIQKNPYQLAKDIWGIGFKTADDAAQKLGIAKDSEIRIDAGVEWVLNELAGNGHTCFPIDKFLEKAHEILDVDAKLIDDRLEIIEKEERIVTGVLTIENQLMACIWLKVFHVCERGIGIELQRLEKEKSPLQEIDLDKSIESAEQELYIQLAKNQKLAVKNSLAEKVHIITGGPGTGKSTITKVILKIAKPLTENILLAAPTGRAAKRMAEITGMEAKTIHSLLKFDFNINGFKHNRDNPLDCELIIVDEASMIDTVLMYSLLKAIPSESKIIFVGDTDQLPSVGAGNVLKDMIESKTLPTTQLTEIFRQAKDSQIIINAHRINAGVFPEVTNAKNSDFFFVNEEDTEKMTETIVGLVQKRLPKAYGFDAINDIQVLSPMNRGIIGNRNLNEILQKKLNPSYQPLVKAGRTFHEKDKVMQIRNNYDKDVFNGDVGRIRKIDTFDQEVTVNFDGRDVIYDFPDLDQLVLAYSVSVHKYQGSECPCIILPVHQSHYNMLFRNLIYTGITRGKKMVVVIGTMKALAMAVNNNRVAKRFTGLREVLGKSH